MHEELKRFAALADQARADGVRPYNKVEFCINLGGGCFKVTSDELNTLTKTYLAYEPILAMEYRVQTLSGIISAANNSTLDETARKPLEFFVQSLANVLIVGGWGNLDRKNDYLHICCKSMQKLVTTHLPLLTDDALKTYFSHSRKFTQYAKPGLINSFRLHSGSEIFDDVDLLESSTRALPNQALMGLIHHFCPSDGRTIRNDDFRIRTPEDAGAEDPIQMLVGLSQCLDRLAGAGLYLPIKYADLVVATQLIDRLALAASTTQSGDVRRCLLDGIVSLTNLVLHNRPKKLASKDYNLFLEDTSGFVFYEKKASDLLENGLLSATRSQLKLDGLSAKAAQDLNWAAVRNCVQVHGRHQSCGYDNQNLITQLLPYCKDNIQEPGALKGFKPEQQAMIVANVQDTDLKRRLMAEYRDCRGHVLTSDLGM